MLDHPEIYTQFFSNHELFFSSHTMFINASTKEFTHVNNAIPSHGIAIEHFCILQDGCQCLLRT